MGNPCLPEEESHTGGLLASGVHEVAVAEAGGAGKRRVITVRLRWRRDRQIERT